MRKELMRFFFCSTIERYITPIIDYVKKIIDNGYAYVSNGSVYFDTNKYLTDGHHELRRGSVVFFCCRC